MLGEELLSPFACGVLAHLAFDSAAESRELREFFQLLHSLLSAALALGCGELQAEMRPLTEEEAPRGSLRLP